MPHLVTLHSSRDERPASRAQRERSLVRRSGDLPERSALRHQGVEEEMNRFHGALRRARHELRDDRRGLQAVGQGLEQGADAEANCTAINEEDALLRDSLVLLEVERTILDERWPTEEALEKVLEERRRLARLVGGEAASLEIACLERAFARVVTSLASRFYAKKFPDNGKADTRH
jgi:phosphoenolpyruvate-protein kinase (PTS system EI component)